MTHHEFDILTARYLAGDCSQEEITFLEKWSDMHMQRNFGQDVFQNESEALEAGERLWQDIRSESGIRKSRFTAIPLWLSYGAVACIAVILGYYFMFPSKPIPVSGSSIHGMETKNVTHSAQELVLPDGSVVTLEKGSKLITSENYGSGTRTVYLTGEAFFQIKRNTKVPFLVRPGDLVTEVLGTSFRIRPQNNRTIEVSVKTGKVSVYASNHDQTRKFNGVIITRNQRVLYDTEHKTIRQDIVDDPQLIEQDISVSTLQFDETTIDAVLPVIQKAYGVDIVVANPILNQCAFTGDLNGLTLYKQLDFVCGVINARYEIRGTTIFITGKGCKGTD